MPIYHFKRLRMYYDLELPLWSPPTLVGFCMVPWHTSLLEIHAQVKHRSFAQEVDANVFGCFATRSGCRRLMQEIAQRESFLPEATWLVLEIPAALTLPADLSAVDTLKFLRQQGLRLTKACGTVQGLALNEVVGSIQNLGVVASHRGHGLGSALLHQALLGFKQRGLNRAVLEVTNDNVAAVRLYQRLGWRLESVQYKAVEILDRS